MLTDDEKIQAIGSVLNDPARPMKERFRALFTLKNLGGKKAIDCIVEGFSDSSALLKHECAYCLGQMQDPYAVTYLINVLKDGNQEPMVRHEAGEALGAIGNPDVLDLLKSYCNDPVPEVAETCQLAVKRLQWLTDSKKHEDNLTSNPFTSVDPAPPSTELDIGLLQKKLTDETLPLFDRYRAMFSLRNIGTEKAIKALASGLECNDSALFRHEVAFVLGQLQHEAGVPFLKKRLDLLEENEMVRHECAEALGAVASAQCQEILKKYLSDEKRVVRESCEVALDMCDYENSNEFQYANTLLKI